MLKLSRTGIGLLSAQYRSVLKKCFLLNLAAAGLLIAPAAQAVDLEPGYLNASDPAITAKLNTEYGNQINADDTATNRLDNGTYYAKGLAMSGDITDYRINGVSGEAWIQNEGTIAIGYVYNDPTSSTMTEVPPSVSGFSATIANVNRVANSLANNNGGSVLNNLNHTPLPASADEYQIRINLTQFANNTNSFFAPTATEIYGGVISNVRDNEKMGSMNMTNTTFINNYAMSNADILGGVIYNGSMEIQAEGYPVSDALIISNNNTYTNNGAFNNNLGVTSGTLYDDVVKVWVEDYNSAAAQNAYGGVVYNESHFNSTGDKFQGNAAVAQKNAHGGAIYNGSNTHTHSAAAGGGTWTTTGVLTVTNDTFTGNRVESSSSAASEMALGGAVYNSGTATFSGNNTFSTNTATNTGGTAGGGAIANFVGGNMTFNDQSTFAYNTATGASGSGNGGAIGNILGVITNNGTMNFDHNSANGYGGAISNLAATFTNAGTQAFTNNSSATAGGAIYNNTQTGMTGTFTNTDTGTQTFSQNSAASGGAIYNNADFVNNGTQEFTNNTASQFGGAIYNESSYTGLSGQFQGNQATVDGNTAVGGGAIFNEGTMTATATQSFESNIAQSTLGSAYGGAISSTGGAGSGITGLSAGFSKNEARSYASAANGGAVYNAGESALTFNTSIFSENKATGTTGAGGAIYNNASVSSIGESGILFSKNQVIAGVDNAVGGAVYNGGTMTLGTGTIFTENSAQLNSSGTSGGSYGGAVYNSGTLNLSNTEFTKNTVGATVGTGMTGFVAAGGAIYNTGTIAAAENSIQNFSENSVNSANSSVHGGALYNGTTGTITGMGGTFSQNTATSDNNNVTGGAIHNEGTLNGTTLAFSLNVAQTTKDGYGGGVYNNGTLSSVGQFENNLVSANNAYGGGIYSQKTLTLNDGSRFVGNHVDGVELAEGGAIAIVNATGDTTITGASFNNNYAYTQNAGYGGAIYNNNSNTLTSIIDSDFTSNYILISEMYDQEYKEFGGAIYNNGNDGEVSRLAITSETADVNISGNLIRVATTAASPRELFYGGAIYNGENGNMLISTTDADHKIDIKLNKTNYGGAIYNAASGANVTVGDVDYSASLSISAVNGDINITNNEAFIFGGALMNNVGFNGTTTLMASSATLDINNNRAGDSGGAVYNNLGSTLLLQVGDGGKIRITDNTAAANRGGGIYNVGATTTLSNLNGLSTHGADLRFRNNKAESGAAIYNETQSGNGSKFEGELTNTKVIFSDNVATGGKGGAIYNEEGSTVDMTMHGTTEFLFQSVSDDIYNLGIVTFTGDSTAPNIPTLSSISTFASGDNQTRVFTNSTFAGTGTYNINYTNLELGTTGYINYEPIMNLNNSVITLNSGSFMNLSTKDTLVNNDFNVASNSTLTYNASDAASEISSINLANTVNNSGLVNVADNVLTAVKINTLRSDDGTIKIDVHDAAAQTDKLKADVITINNRIYGTTKIAFDNSDHVVMGVQDRIYFAQTQADQSLSDYTFKIDAENSNYTIDVGYDANGSVYDWYLYRSGLDPQDVAYINLPRATVEQSRGLALQISRSNRGDCNCQRGMCDNRVYCRYSSSSPKLRLWATPMFRFGKYKKPVETDIRLSGLEYGLDYQPTHSDLIGVFGSYRDGRYEHDGNDKKYKATKGHRIDIVSKLFGAYYRKYYGNLYMMGAVYGGEMEIKIKADNGVTADTKAIDVGAHGEIGYDIRTSRRSLVTPSVGATYDFIKIKKLTDSENDKAEFGTVHDVELEAALKFEQQLNSEYELPTSIYLKPSVIQTLASGGKVKIRGNEFTKTVENETIGRVEVGGDAEVIEDLLSVGAFGNYSFGSAYNAWGIGGNVRLTW